MTSTDLINKVNQMPVVEVQVLYKTYESILEFVEKQEQLPYFVYTIDIAIKHINETYPTLDKDWKTWAVVVLKHQYFQNKINSETDIVKSIEEFVKYYNENYSQYILNMVSVTEFDRDYGFVIKHINN